MKWAGHERAEPSRWVKEEQKACGKVDEQTATVHNKQRDLLVAQHISNKFVLLATFQFFPTFEM